MNIHEVSERTLHVVISGLRESFQPDCECERMSEGFLWWESALSELLCIFYDVHKRGWESFGRQCTYISQAFRKTHCTEAKNKTCYYDTFLTQPPVSFRPVASICLYMCSVLNMLCVVYRNVKQNIIYKALHLCVQTS